MFPGSAFDAQEIGRWADHGKSRTHQPEVNIGVNMDVNIHVNLGLNARHAQKRHRTDVKPAHLVGKLLDLAVTAKDNTAGNREKAQEIA